MRDVSKKGYPYGQETKAKEFEGGQVGFGLLLKGLRSVPKFGQVRTAVWWKHTCQMSRGAIRGPHHEKERGTLGSRLEGVCQNRQAYVSILSM